MWITNLSVRRRVTMIMIIGALLVLGLTRLREMPLEYFPSIDIPVVSVFTTYPGAGPEEIQERVTKPLEDAVSIINGVDQVQSQSQENVSAVTIQFDLEIDLDVAAADVRDAVSRARRLFPDDVEQPIVYKLDIGAFPIVSMGVTGNRSAKDMLSFVDDRIKPRLGEVRGVAAVNVTGGEVREVRVAAHEDRLEAVGLSVAQLAGLVAAENVNVPSGELKEGGRSFAVRAMGQFQNLDEIRRLRIPTPLGGIVYLSEVAEVMDTVVDPESITRLNGKSTVGSDILKQSDANTVAVSEGIHNAIEELNRELPADIEFSVYNDSAEDTREAIRDVREALILGALLAALVTYLFLHNFRAMIIVALAIPTSIIATFFPIYFFGFTLNVMVLLGLSLSVGILVDDSIVVIENIERHRRMGEEPPVAALNGRAEIGGAAVAITLVDVVVFVPVAFMGGVVGRVFFAFGITVTIATLFSLLMSFTLTPMLASWWFSRETAERQEAAAQHWSGRIFAALDAPFRLLERTYRRFLPATLRFPIVAVVLGYAGLIAVGVFAFRSGRVGQEFFPEQATGRVSILLEAAPGTRIEVMDAHLKHIEIVLDKQRFPEVRDLRVTAGSQGTSMFGAGNVGGRYGVANLYLTGKTERRKASQRTDAKFARDLRAELADMPSVTVKVARATGETGGTGANIELILQGAEPEAIDDAAATLTRRMRALPELLYTEISSKPGRPEVRARIDRVRSAEFGMTAAEVAMTLRAAYAGDTSSKYRERGDEYDLRTQLAQFDRTHAADVENLFVGLSPTGQLVRLRDVAEVYLSTGPSRIERRDRERAVVVSAYLQEAVRLSAGQAGVAAILKDMDEQGNLAGVNWKWGGEVERMQENFAYIKDALILAILLVYIVTAALYTNILQPLNVMLTVPMAMGGGILALAITGDSISIASLIGLIMVLGLVGKNAILIVDYTNTLRARGMDVDQALLEAGPTRMRPVLMTALSTTAALLPTALAMSEASEFRAPMAIVVIGGLVLSTVLSLLIVPAFYKITDSVERTYYGVGGGLLRLINRLRGGGEE